MKIKEILNNKNYNKPLDVLGVNGGGLHHPIPPPN